MPFLIPPMDPEPPPDFVDFVAERLAALHCAAARLAGGDQHADEIYPPALSDLAGRWRRLRWHRQLGRWLDGRVGHRLGGRTGRRLDCGEVADDFLRRRLSIRATQWREESVDLVEVHVLSAQPGSPTPPAPHPPDSLGTRLAPLLASTIRPQARPVAEAAIAWEHAYRRHRRRQLGRGLAAGLLALGWLDEAVARLAGQ